MLRAVILILVLAPHIAASQSLPNAATHGALIDERMDEAAKVGEDLASRLKLLEREFDLPEDLAERALDSLRNGRVRDMLNVAPEDLPQLEGEAERYPGGVFLFASFSIPDPSLKAILKDADRLGVPVVFNGFVENSVLATEARVRALYEDKEIAQGFIIDPTLFERFDVRAVPTLVSTSVDLDVCVSPGCSGDAIPLHDRVAGNVPLATLLTIIAKGNAEHADPARAVLEAAK